LPGSGSGAELLAWAGIDADHIATAARKLVGARQNALGYRWNEEFT
jgi:transketolase